MLVNSPLSPGSPLKENPQGPAFPGRPSSPGAPGLPGIPSTPGEPSRPAECQRTVVRIVDTEISQAIYYPPEVRRGKYWGWGVFL